MKELIVFDHVGKTFNGKKALADVSFEIRTGEIFVLVGSSGSGKTTSLKMMNALQVPTDGDIYFKGKRVKEYDIQKLRWQMGYVLQQIALFPTMTVLENIEVIPEMLGWSKEKRNAKARSLLEAVHLEPNVYAKRMPSELSGGEQQRVGILRALAAEPDVVLMDEPFSALDPISRDQLQNLLLDLHKQFKNTIVFVTHDMNEAMKLGDRIAVMHEGELIQCDTPENIALHPKSAFVAEFFKGTEKTWQPEGQPISFLQEQGYVSHDTASELPLAQATTPVSGLFSQLAQAGGVRLDAETVLTAQDVLRYLADSKEDAQ